MSISSSICADYANRRKKEWTEKFRDAYRKAGNEKIAILEFINIVKEMEEFEFVE